MNKVHNLTIYTCKHDRTVYTELGTPLDNTLRDLHVMHPVRTFGSAALVLLSGSFHPARPSPRHLVEAGLSSMGIARRDYFLSEGMLYSESNVGMELK